MPLAATRIVVLLLAAVITRPACGEPGAGALPGSEPRPVEVLQDLTGTGSDDPALSEPPGASPLLNRYYQGADFDRWTDVFERRGREVFDQRFQIVHASRVREGMRVADIGAGTGFFAALFARAVGPEGVVYAVDTSPDFIAGIEERARTYRVENLVPIVNTQQSTALEPNSIDLAFLCDSYHHFEDPQAMLDSIYRALAPYGSLIIIDMHRIPGLSSPWAMGHLRAGRDQVVTEVKSAGFRLVEEPRFLRDNYFLRFEKVSGEPDLKVGPIETDSTPKR
jgi:ubiquinone/menaquinone biosynthesis C-methylase UbiE